MTADDEYPVYLTEIQMKWVEENAPQLLNSNLRLIPALERRSEHEQEFKTDTEKQQYQQRRGDVIDD